MSKKAVPFPENARLVIPESFKDCLSYGEQVRYLYEMIDKLQQEIENLEARIDNKLQIVDDRISYLHDAKDSNVETKDPDDIFGGK